MRAVATERTGWGLPSDAAVAGSSVAVLACGTLLTSMGMLASDPALAATGGLMGLAALVTLVAAGWIDGLLLVALAVPLPAVYRSETLRIAATLPLTAAVVSGWLLYRGLSGSPPRLAQLPVRSFGALLGVFSVATLFAASPVDSVRELFNFGLLLVFLLTAVDSFSREPARRERVVDFLVTSAAVSGALALLEMVNLIPGEFPRTGTPFNRAALGFGQPNGLGLFLALALPLAVHRLGSVRGATRVIAGFAAFAIAVGLVATFSRGAILAVLFGSLPLWVTGDRAFLARIWLIGLIALVLFDLASGGALRDTVARSMDDWSIEQRFALTTVGVLVFLANPLIGVGPGGFAATLDQFGVLVPQLTDLQPTPHNAYVQVAAETGALGLVIFLWFVLGVLRVMIRSAREADPSGPDGERGLRRALLWSFGIFGLACLLDWPFPHGTGQVVMLLIAMGCSSGAARR